MFGRDRAARITVDLDGSKAAVEAVRKELNKPGENPTVRIEVPPDLPDGTRFDIVLQENEGGTDWSFKSVVMQDCIITSATPSAATISGAPSATFSGFSLGAKAEPKQGDTVRIP